MASSPPTDLELVTFNFIRNNYEKKYKQNIPMALKYLTFKFSNMIIGSKLLTLKEDMDFFKLLLTKLPSIRRFNHLFRASDHKYSAAKFHDFCDDKGGTITIIKSNWGNIFGGYTSKSWTSYGGYYKDENAFLFVIKSNDESIESKCPLLLELKKDHIGYAIYCDANVGPIFGGGGTGDIYIGDNCNKSDSRSCQMSYGTPTINICGGNKEIFEGTYAFQVIDYSVFQIVE